MPKKKSAKKSNQKKSKKKIKFNFFRFLWNYLIKWIFVGIGWIFVTLWKGIVSLFKRSTMEVKRRAPPKKKAKIIVLETIKGNYANFWNKLVESDSLIGIILGARGSGKTAVALTILENLKGSQKNFYAMGFSKVELPRWIKTVDKIEDLENNSYVIIDEGGILFSSRDAMSSSNKMLSELLLVARHKNLTILFISQNSSNLEINTLRQADFLILKKSSLLQRDFERKIVGKIYEEYQNDFEKYKNIKGAGLIYADNFVGFFDNELPGFWSSNISKGFR